MLNWRPVVDLEIRAIERKKLLFELRRENARYAKLNARLDAICSSFDSSSPPPPSTPGPSPT
jgi:tRNA1(Val) A37 N6-methylase TrmN6